MVEQNTYCWVGGATTIYIWRTALGGLVSPTFPLFAGDGFIGYIPDAKVLDVEEGWKCQTVMTYKVSGSCQEMGRPTLYPYNFSSEGKKLFGIADEGYARSKLRY